MTSVLRCLLIGAGVLLFALLFTSPISPYAARSLKHCWQLGHVALFAVWTFLLCDILIKRCNGIRLCLTVFISTLLLGVLIELIQQNIGRNFSLLDLGYNLIGSLLSLSLLVYRDHFQLPQTPRRTLYTVTSILLISALSPLLFYLADEFSMYRNFPLLADFESKRELGRWKGDLEISKPGQSAEASNMLRITLHTTHYSGASLVYFPGNWSQYQQFYFDAFNPDSEELRLTLRIHDESHYQTGHSAYDDRFNKTFVLHSGWNAIRVDLKDVASAPRDRLMDMTRIQGIGLFTVDSPITRFMYLDNMRLSDSESAK